MHVPHLPESQSESADVSLSHSDPYRPPSEVPGEAKRGWLKSPVTWLVVAGALAGIVVTLATATISSVKEHVGEFGTTRGGPPEVMVEYERVSAKEE